MSVNEDVAHQVVMLVCNSVKQGLQYISTFYMNKRIFGKNKYKRVKIAHGKQSIKKLQRQNKNLASVDISGDKALHSFKKIAKKYKIDFAVKQDKTTKKYVIFFKCNDEAVMTQVCKEWTASLNKNQNKESLNKRLERKEIETQRQSQEKAAEKGMEKAGEKINNAFKSRPEPEIEKNL